MVTWDDIDDTLYDGTKEAIRALTCPDCGGKIDFRYNEPHKSFSVQCKDCGYLSKATKVSYTPNCVTYFGEEHTIG